MPPREMIGEKSTIADDPSRKARSILRSPGEVALIILGNIQPSLRLGASPRLRDEVRFSKLQHRKPNPIVPHHAHFCLYTIRSSATQQIANLIETCIFPSLSSIVSSFPQPQPPLSFPRDEGNACIDFPCFFLLFYLSAVARTRVKTPAAIPMPQNPSRPPGLPPGRRAGPSCVNGSRCRSPQTR